MTDSLPRGLRIREACRARDMSMMELKRRTGMSWSSLYKLATGRADAPRPSTVARIAAAIGCDWRELVLPDDLAREHHDIVSRMEDLERRAEALGYTPPPRVMAVLPANPLDNVLARKA